MLNFPRRLSSPLFGIALFCFLLPFARISCQGERVASFTGLQLATGTTVQGEKVKGELFAAAAIAATAFGFALSLVRRRGAALLTLAAGATGAIALLVLKARLDEQIRKRGEGALDMQYTFAYWLTFTLLLLATAANWRPLRMQRASLPSSPHPPPQMEVRRESD